jgi:hypothetical protein
LRNAIIYLCLGDGRHVDELRFAISSALRYWAPEASWSVVLYTDVPDSFADLPVQIRTVAAETAAAWAGPYSYIYLGKIHALADALTRADRAAIVDGDTYFCASPERLISRIAPGRSIMHMREGLPNSPEAAGLRRVLQSRRPRDRRGGDWPVTEREILWNSGVVGLHRVDAALCAEAIHLTEELLNLGFGEESRIAEMIGFGSVLSRKTRIREVGDLVVHYWRDEIRSPFLDRLVAVGRETDAAVAFERLWPDRPRLGPRRRLKDFAKRTMARVGLET